MAITNILPATEIINRVAVEVGQLPTSDPFAADDPVFVKLKYLLQIAGEELIAAYPWEFLTKSHEITTQEGDTGAYPLPADFSYMIPQTGWERSNERRLGEALSAQEWTYLQAKKLGANSLHAAFRISEGVFNVFPTPPPAGLNITFEYISDLWVRSATQPYTYSDTITIAAETPMFDKTLLTRYLKLKYLQTTGFDTTVAEDDFAQCFSFLTGKDKGAMVLNAGRARGYPYLGAANIPDTGFGL